MATQAERTAKTTARLLDATIDVLVKQGYRGTSTTEVCARAKVSRGAQLHHFPTKQELVAAAVEHLMNRRLKEFASRLNGRSKLPASLSDLATYLLDVYSGETFYAWLELVVAARTDKKLRALMGDIDARFVRGAERLCRDSLMPDGASDQDVAARTRLILSMLDGLAMHQILSRDDALSRSALRAAAGFGVFSPKESKS